MSEVPLYSHGSSTTTFNHFIVSAYVFAPTSSQTIPPAPPLWVAGLYRGTSLTRNSHPPRTIIGP
jgi:hypothetical protein